MIIKELHKKERILSRKPLRGGIMKAEG